MQKCSQCGNTHVGLLIFATPGTRVLLLNDWEACCDEEDLEFQLRNQLSLIKVTSSLASFLALANLMS